MSLILYQYGGGDGVLSLSPPCMKVQLAMRLLDLPHEVVDVRTPNQVKRVSRTGRLPAIELPDGRKVVFSSSRRGRKELYQIDLDGRNLRRVTGDFGNCSNPAWSPWID